MGKIFVEWHPLSARKSRLGLALNNKIIFFLESPTLSGLFIETATLFAAILPRSAFTATLVAAILPWSAFAATLVVAVLP
ncbi:MAG: hypothetical protein ACKOCH_18850, partial [Bacteroidota bacterium]